MSLKADCRECGKSYTVPDERAGKRFKCTACRAVVTVPLPKKRQIDPWDVPAPSGTRKAVASQKATSQRRPATVQRQPPRPAAQQRLPPLITRSSSQQRRSKSAPAGKPLFGSVWLDALVWALGGITAASIVILSLGYGGVYLAARFQQQASLVTEPSLNSTAKGKLTPKLLIADGVQPGADWEENGLKMKFCWCPAGSFQMGSPAAEPGRGSDEEQRQVAIAPGFWIGKFEVTQGEYEAIVGENPSRLTPYSLHLKEKRDPIPQDLAKKFPVDIVTYGGAEAFCRKLTARERREGRLTADQEYALPTEAQWEYACRAGTTSATAFADRLGSNQANFDGTKPYNGATAGKFLKESQPVGSYPPNPWGICDMHGNVREWCRDYYISQPGEAAGLDTTQPLEVIQQRVVRGGDFQSSGAECRSASRSKRHVDKPDFRLGFRIVLVKTGAP